MTVIRRLTDGLWRELRYALWLTVHPFKGFWEIKKEGRGSGRTATLFLLCYLLVTALSGLYTGYLFREEDVLDFSAPKAMLQVLLLFFGFCVANWGLTCLFDGEGTFADICAFAAAADPDAAAAAEQLFPADGAKLLYHAVWGRAALVGLFAAGRHARDPSILLGQDRRDAAVHRGGDVYARLYRPAVSRSGLAGHRFHHDLAAGGIHAAMKGGHDT